MRALFFRRCRLGRRAATVVLFLLAALPGAARAGEAPAPLTANPIAKANDTAAPRCAIFKSDRPLALTPPSLTIQTSALTGASPLHRLLFSPTPSIPHNPRAINPAGPVLLNLDISLRYLRLAVHGDYRAGLLPFLGTSTTALGGLRLRF